MNKRIWAKKWRLFYYFSGVVSTKADDVSRDTREKEDVTLECRFSPTAEKTLFYWTKHNKETHDSVAIGNVPLDNNYK